MALHFSYNEKKKSKEPTQVVICSVFKTHIFKARSLSRAFIILNWLSQESIEFIFMKTFIAQ